MKKKKVASKTKNKPKTAAKTRKLSKTKLKKLTGGGLVIVPVFTPYKPPVFHPPGFFGGPALHPGSRPSGPSGFSSGANRASAGRGSSF